MKLIQKRKAIIDLIERYMDKTLSEWCLCFVKWVEERWIVKDYIVEYSSLSSGYTSSKREYNSLYDKKLIIWHYDITAVLKYIEKKWYWIEFDCLTNEADCYFMIKDDVWYDANLIWTFPNKPLHLYDTNEDEQLLDLLLKLK